MKTFLWIVGIFSLLVVMLFAYVFFNMVFISQITQWKVKFSPEFIPLLDGVSVTEVDHNAPPAAEEIPNTGDNEGGQEMLLFEDGTIKEGRRVFEGDPGNEVLVSFNKARQESHVFLANNVFQYAEDRKGNKLGSFSSPEFSYIDFVLPVNKKYMLIDGRMAATPYPSERELWQVEYDSLNKVQLSAKPYFTFSRPPKVFVFEEYGEQAVVYYTGDFSFAFGGDSSRPEFSVLRIYNSQHPEGRDIAKIGFKAGTVLEVSKVDDGYVLIADPSLPTMADKPRVSSRKWKVTLK
jgi:hypothetical protein